MKSSNLNILKNNSFNVPDFKVVTMGNDVDISNLKGDRFAVRSNCDVEDREERSYAGNFETVLNVDKEHIKDAVSKVLDSYNKVPDYDGSKTVIVQEMIDASYSGVAFSINPLGVYSEIVVCYNKGAGAVVDGTQTANTVYYNKHDKSYIKYVSQQLEQHVLEEIVDNVGRIEELYDKPMDIEFAIKDNKVYILQARPITGMDLSKRIVLDNSNIVESYPGISLPLTQDFAKSIYYGVFKYVVLRITEDEKLVEAMDRNLKDMVACYNWRMYYNITNWYNIIRLLPMSGKIIPIWQNMLGVEDKNVTFDDIKVPKRTKLKITKNFVKYLRTTPANMAELNIWFKNTIDCYSKQIDNCKSIEELLKNYNNIQNEITEKWYITLVNDMYTFIYTHLSGERNRQYISDIKDLESKKPLIMLNDVSDVVRKYGINSDEYKKIRQEFISLYGDRCTEELKLETRTYRTNPELLENVVIKHKKYEVNDPGINNISKCGKNVKKAKLGIMNREISRLNRSRIFGLAREIMLRIGELFVEEGKLLCREDIFYLYMSDIENRDTLNLKEVVEERKEIHAFYKKIPSTNRIEFSERIIDKPVDNNDMDVSSYKSIDKSKLTGSCVSNGKLKAQVVIVDSPQQLEEGIDVKDKIIVTKSTDPGWVYLIEQCSGIITEKGSLLSHTAIISRELKKPALVNVRDATAILKTGDVVEMNADAGVIKISQTKEAI